MEGTLPASLTGLDKLAEFLADGTALCAPAEQAFLRWLDGMRKWRVRLCEREGGSAAYLTQAVQSLESPVPLVDGEPALLRVFISVPDASGEGMPEVRARFYRGEFEVYVADIAASGAPIPTSLNEGDLEASVNASIPASVIQPGLEMVVEIDPDSTMDASLGVARRIPAEGRARVWVREVPELGFTIVPFLWPGDPDSASARLVSGLAADDRALLEPINALLPVDDIDLKVHEAVVTESDRASGLLAEVGVIRVLEGAASDRYYQGIMAGAMTGAGAAYRPGRTSFSIPDPLAMAHQLGHNFGLRDAPCQVDDSDTNSSSDGKIGAWGYDMRGDSLVAPRTCGLMSDSTPRWISEYSFTKAFDYRVHEEAARGVGSVDARQERVLLLWGGAGANGNPFLEHAFVVDAPPVLPALPEGEYAVAGHDAGGGELFSFRFGMSAVTDADGRSAFVYALPVQQEWAGALASITLSGPGGSFTLDGSGDRAAAILRDPETGEVRAIFRDAPPSVVDAADRGDPLGSEAAAELSLPAGLEVLVSRGIPRVEDRRLCDSDASDHSVRGRRHHGTHTAPATKHGVGHAPEHGTRHASRCPPNRR